MEEIISIIVPIYNAEKKIDRCLTSLINQTYKNIQIILINDGSSDNSLLIMNKWKRLDSRVEVYSHENKGVSHTRNIGLKHAIGKYVEFVDIDDYIELSMVNELKNNIEKQNVDLVVCGYNLVSDTYKKSIKLFESKIYNIESAIENFDELYRVSFFSSIWNKLYKRELIKNDFDVNINCGEDLSFNIDYISNCNKIYYLNKVLYNYMSTEEDSLSKKYRINDYANIIDLRNKIIKYSVIHKVSLNDSFDNIFGEITISYSRRLEKYQDISKLIKYRSKNNIKLKECTCANMIDTIYKILIKCNMVLLIFVLNKLNKLRRNIF